MKITWLRNLVRRCPAAGVPLAGFCLFVRAIVRKKPLAALLTTAVLYYAYWQGFVRQSEPTYDATDLGTLRGGSWARPASINNPGIVVGSANTGEKNERGEDMYHAFRWEKGRIGDLGAKGGDGSWASCINDRGQIALTISKSNPSETRAYVWERNSMTELTGEGGHTNLVSAINDKKQAAGAISTVANMYTFAARWNKGNVQDLGTRSFSDGSYGAGINGRGEVVGVFGQGWLVFSAFVYRKGSPEVLPGLGGIGDAALAINNKGQIVGYSENERVGFRHAVIWSGGKIKDLGTLGGENSEAYAINDKAQIVGAAQIRQGKWHSALWEGRHIVDLNTAIPRNSGWILESATAINKRGQIVGIGSLKGKQRGFLLTPRSEQ